MRIQAIAFDLDDTLLRDDLTISVHTVDVLRRAAEAGIRIIPASGRAAESMKGFVEQIGCAACYIACNGAEVWSDDHRLLNRYRIPHDVLMDIARYGKQRQVYAQHYDGPYFYYSEEGHWAESYARSSMLKGVYVGDLEAWLADKESSKILMMSKPETIADMLEEARARFEGQVSVTCSKPYFLEFNPLMATKGNALRWCGEHLGFEPAQAAAFGDSLNDLSMLQAAGMGVAMANARPDVKALIGLHCPSNMEDGVACFIEEHILNSQREDIHDHSL